MATGELGRRSRNAIGFGLLGALSLLVLLGLAAPAPADARHVVTVKGVHLVAPPTVKKNRVLATALLSRKMQRRLGTEAQVATLRIRRSMMVRVPRPNGKGRVPVEVEKIRSGDRIRARVETKRRHRGKGRAGAAQARVNPPRSNFRVRWMRVVQRQSRFSVDELTDFVVLLAQQLAALSNKFDAFAAQVADGFGSLQAQIDALKGDLAKLQQGLDDLKAALDNLETALGELEDALDALSDDVAALRDDLTALQGTVAGLQTQVDGMQAEIDAIIEALVTEGSVDVCGVLPPPLPDVCP